MLPKSDVHSINLKFQQISIVQIEDLLRSSEKYHDNFNISQMFLHYIHVYTCML